MTLIDFSQTKFELMHGAREHEVLVVSVDDSPERAINVREIHSHVFIPDDPFVVVNVEASDILIVELRHSC